MERSQHLSCLIINKYLHYFPVLGVAITISFFSMLRILMVFGTQAYDGDSAITDEKIVKIGNCKRDRSETIIDSNYFRYKIEFLIRYVKFIKTL